MCTREFFAFFAELLVCCINSAFSCYYYIIYEMQSKLKFTNLTFAPHSVLGISDVCRDMVSVSHHLYIIRTSHLILFLGQAPTIY